MKIIRLLSVIMLIGMTGLNANAQKYTYKTSRNFEVQMLGVGTDGTKTFKIYATEKKVDRAIALAKKAAVEMVLFRGLPSAGTISPTPALCDSKTEEQFAAYFEEFFTPGGKYLRYINLTNEGEIPESDILKVKKGYKVGLSVQIMYDNLRRDLEADGILKPISKGHAKKPIIMVVPSDIYCARKGYTTTYKDESGASKSVSDFRKAVSMDENMRLVISELSTIMAQRGFPLKDLEQTLKKMQDEEAEMSLITSGSGAAIAESPVDILKRTAKADIILDIDFDIKKRGPNQYISFNLRGVDAYTNKIITAASGEGAPSSSAGAGLLIEEAVLNYMDSFNAALEDHFDDILENGREVNITVRMFDSAPFNFEEEFEFEGETVLLIDVIDYWMDENVINHSFNRTSSSENRITYEQVRIPLTKKVLGKERAIDTRSFATDLGRFLSKEPFNLPYKIYDKGLGEVWLILGDK